MENGTSEEVCTGGGGERRCRSSLEIILRGTERGRRAAGGRGSAGFIIYFILNHKNCARQYSSCTLSSVWWITAVWSVCCAFCDMNSLTAPPAGQDTDMDKNNEMMSVKHQNGNLR